jgi:hypothetical protein
MINPFLTNKNWNMYKSYEYIDLFLWWKIHGLVAEDSFKARITSVAEAMPISTSAAHSS